MPKQRGRKKSGFNVEYAPWYNKDEFVQVYHYLYSKNIYERESGVRKVLVWESRAYPSLPAGVCITATLVNAQVQDEYGNAMGLSSTLKPYDYRVLYCTALTRFTNLVSDENYHQIVKNRVAASKLAKVPEWIVQLRHSATHRAMPGLTALREGAACAMVWLDENFWKLELGKFVDFVDKEKLSIADIQTFISGYLNCQSELMLSNLTDKEKKAKTDEVQTLLGAIRVCALHNHKEFFKVLVSPGFLLHSATDLGSLLLDDGKLFIIENSINLPERLIEIWMPVIEMLCETNLLQELLESLFECQKSGIDLHKKLAAAWCRYLIDTDRFYQVHFQGVVETSRPCLNWIRLHASCAKYPSKYTPLLLPGIADKIDPPLNETKKNLLMAMVAIHTGATVPSDIQPRPAKHPLFTFDDVKHVFTEEADGDKSKKSYFEQASAYAGWESIPLGAIFCKKPPIEVIIEEKEKPDVTPSESVEPEPMVQEDIAESKEEEDSGIQQESSTLFQISGVYSVENQDAPEEPNYSESVVMYPLMA